MDSGRRSQCPQRIEKSLSHFVALSELQESLEETHGRSHTQQRLLTLKAHVFNMFLYVFLVFSPFLGGMVSPLKLHGGAASVNHLFLSQISAGLLASPE